MEVGPSQKMTVREMSLFEPRAFGSRDTCGSHLAVVVVVAYLSHSAIIIIVDVMVDNLSSPPKGCLPVKCCAHPSPKRNVTHEVTT